MTNVVTVRERPLHSDITRVASRLTLYLSKNDLKSVGLVDRIGKSKFGDLSFGEISDLNLN